MRLRRGQKSSPVEEPEVEEEEQQDEVMDDDDDEQEVEDNAGEVAGVAAGEPEGTAHLQFKQTLNWRAGRPIAVADLLRRLEILSKELLSYEQDEVQRDTLLQTAKELASSQLLQHKDKGVRALTACCVVDMFRLCAPDAPYTQQQLKDIFTLIVQSIFPALADPSNAYNKQHLYVLKSLAEVKSVILLTDAPGAASLIEALFKECFDVLSGPTKSNSEEELSKNVEHHMTVVLSTLVDETEGLPNEVTHTILAQFLRTSPKAAMNGAGKAKIAQLEESQGTLLLLKEAPPAYNMAKNICNASPDKMSRNITRYWGAIVAEASSSLPISRAALKKGKRRGGGDDGDDSEDEQAKMAVEDMEEIKKAHDLLRELWRATPSVLRDIIPLLENELHEENAQKRILAVETVGDMIAGIGHAGPPAATKLNPAAYPSQSLVDLSERVKVYDFLTTPTSPVSFMSRYAGIYQAFLSRRHDKSNVVRAAWATAVGRILLTSAGGVGMSTDEEEHLTKAFADCLQDVDEKVRHSAVLAVEHFEYDDIVQKLGNRGGVDEQGSILANLADRVKDRKKDVRTDALRLLGKIWGVGVGAIGEGSERTINLLGSIPSKILHAYYINDPEVNVLIDHIIYDSLLPVSYPPIKSKSGANGTSRTRQSQGGEAVDPDRLRTERILILVRSLDEKSKAVFFAVAKKQVQFAKFMEAFLVQCENYNGGVIEQDEEEVKKRLGMLIEAQVKFMPEPSRVKDELWKFAKAHDRRSYALTRFCLASDSDYKKVKNAYLELQKKLDDLPGSSTNFVETISTLVLRCSGLIFNRSHVPAIIEFTKSDENGLRAVAHEVLEQISKDKPDVFKAHVQDLCKSLEVEAPTPKKANEPGAVQDLKACAQFTRQFPAEVSKERKFTQAMYSFINYGTPAGAAKYGALIILLTAEKKKMHAKDIFKQCTEGFEYAKGNFLGRLAALSQLMLLGSDFISDEEADVVVDIAINKVLQNPQATPAPVEGEPDPEWTELPDANCEAKIWALKLLVNRLRAFPDNAGLDDAAQPVFKYLTTMVQKGGQFSKSQPSLAAHQSRMRLVAAQMLLKLCREKHLSARLSATAFNSLAVVAMDHRLQVRAGFVNKITKYLGQLKLSSKFYTPLFLLGHEPDPSIKKSIMTWLMARSAAAARTSDTAMEATFARLLSLLAHHPDWPAAPYSPEELSQSLHDFMEYILFYLQCVGLERNIGLVFHIAQRVKAHQDGVASSSHEDLLQIMNERLYMLSDLSQGVIKKFAEVHNWTIQAWPGRVKLPAGIFALMGDQDTARAVAMKNYLPRSFAEDLEDEVKSALKTKKRKSTAVNGEPRKKIKQDAPERKIKKTKTSGAAKTPKKSRVASDTPASAARRSSRATKQKSYIEISDDESSSDGEDGEDDEEMHDAPGADLEDSVGEADISPEPAEEDSVVEDAETDEQEKEDLKEDIEKHEEPEEAAEEDDFEDEVEDEPSTKSSPKRASRRSAATTTSSPLSRRRKTPQRKVTPRKALHSSPKTVTSLPRRGGLHAKATPEADVEADVEADADKPAPTPKIAVNGRASRKSDAKAPTPAATTTITAKHPAKHTTTKESVTEKQPKAGKSGAKRASSRRRGGGKGKGAKKVPPGDEFDFPDSD